MNLILFNFWPFEKKNLSLSNPALIELFGSSPTASGVSVNPSSALSVPAVNAAVRVISESVASLPINVLKDDGTTKTVNKEHPLFRLLHYAPNAFTSKYDFFLQGQIDLLLYGNTYAYVNRVNGVVREILRLPPTSVSVKIDASSGEPSYEVRSTSGANRRYPYTDVIHVKSLSIDGAAGVAPIHYAREAIALAIALEKTHAALHANGAQPGGVLSVKGKLDAPARERLKLAWQAFQGGLHNRFKTAVLDTDATWTPLSMTGVDTQHLETRRFQIEEISRAFRVPPHLLSELGRATWGNTAEMNQAFLDSTLTPWLLNWIGALSRTLLTPEERIDTRIDFDTGALTRANLAARTDSYWKAGGGSYLLVNEIRALENRPPITGGDVLRDGKTPTPANDNGKSESIAA